MVLMYNRVVAGLASGLAITTVAPLLSQISKTSTNKVVASHSGSIGILNQLAIVLGIFSAQVAGLAATGMKGDRLGGWRYVVLVSGVVAVVQLVVGQTRIRGDLMQEREMERKVWDDDSADEGVQRVSSLDLEEREGESMASRTCVADASQPHHSCTTLLQ